jgi:hypothetical protein
MQMELNVLGKSLPAMLTISDMQGPGKEGRSRRRRLFMLWNVCSPVELL